MSDSGFPAFDNLNELLQYRAETQSDQVLYRFLIDGIQNSQELKYGQLLHNARAIAARLQDRGLSGKNAILLFAPGLDYIESFFGCLLAGVVAVPAYPPDMNRLERTLPRLLSVIRDCQATAVLTTEPIRAIAEYLFTKAPELQKLDWISTDLAKTQSGADYRPFLPDPKTLAFIQYSSGSTGEPKGVLLSHQNLIHNLRLIHQSFGVSRDTVGVVWLPPYHDMGLIGGVIEPMHDGITVILMSPLDFLKKPLSWLEAISHFKGTISGGPNFAFELCVRKAAGEKLSGLDLSSWELAFCGAEPIHQETVEQFVRTFEPYGFRRSAFFPCYGLAEATLIVTGGQKGTPPKYRHLDKVALKERKVVFSEPGDQAKPIVGCGKTFPGQSVMIADPDTRRRLPDTHIGEVWVQGGSVAQGYWNKDKETEFGFHARIPDSGEGPFLRTGDLGFIEDGELFITGRLKDLLIIRGQNHYPQDIEANVEDCAPSIRPGCIAAFTLDDEHEERLAIAAEVDLSPESDSFSSEAEQIARAIRQAVSEHHELKTHTILLLKKGTLPKTSSGKIRRQTTRQQFLDGELEILWQPQMPLLAPIDQVQSAPQRSLASIPHGSIPDKSDIINWLIARLAERLGVNSESLSLQTPFSQMGLDSKEAVNLSGELEDWLGFRLAPSLLWKYPNIDSLAEYLASPELAAGS